MVRNVLIHSYVYSEEERDPSLHRCLTNLTNLRGLACGTKVLLCLRLGGVFVKPPARSAQTLVSIMTNLIPRTRELLVLGLQLTLKLSSFIKFKLELKELSQEIWSQKIKEYERYGHSVQRIFCIEVNSA